MCFNYLGELHFQIVCKTTVVTIVAEQEWNEFLQRIEKEGDPMALCNLGYRFGCHYKRAHASTHTKDPSPSPRHFLSREPTETATFMVEQANRTTKDLFTDMMSIVHSATSMGHGQQWA